MNILKPEFHARFRVKEIGLFGSFARGTQQDTSDIDLLVDFDAHADLFDLIGMAQFLEEKFQRKVDVVPKNTLREEVRESILKEVATL